MRSPAQRRLRLIRLAKLLLVADLVLIGVAGLVWLVAVRDDERAAFGNDGLRGNVAPAGQVVPDLGQVAGVAPVFPSRSELRGRVVLLVATCLECRSGDVLGGALARLVQEDLPRGASIRVVGWDGDPRAWRGKWRLDEAVEVHVAQTPQARAEVQGQLRVGESGYAFLYDPEGRWRTSYSVQQLVPEDVVHDVRFLQR